MVLIWMVSTSSPNMRVIFHGQTMRVTKIAKWVSQVWQKTMYDQHMTDFTYKSIMVVLLISSFVKPQQQSDNSDYQRILLTHHMTLGQVPDKCSEWNLYFKIRITTGGSSSDTGHVTTWACRICLSCSWRNWGADLVFSVWQPLSRDSGGNHD